MFCLFKVSLTCELTVFYGRPGAYKRKKNAYFYRYSGHQEYKFKRLPEFTVAQCGVESFPMAHIKLNL